MVIYVSAYKTKWLCGVYRACIIDLLGLGIMSGIEYCTKNYPNNSLPPVPNFTHVNIPVTELHDHARPVWAEVVFMVFQNVRCLRKL